MIVIMVMLIIFFPQPMSRHRDEPPAGRTGVHEEAVGADVLKSKIPRPRRHQTGISQKLAGQQEGG